MNREPMGFVEAVEYGYSTVASLNSERSNFLADTQITHNADLVIPSSQGSALLITPSMERAAQVIQLRLLQRDGVEISPEQQQLLNEAAEADLQRKRFDESIWSRLFPMLKIKPTKIISI